MCVAYPKQILPCTDYLMPMLIQQLNDEQGEFFVCRRIDKPVSNYVFDSINGRKQLDVDCFGESVVRLSMNLMGGLFEASHLIYQQKGEGRKEWNGGNVCLADYVNCIVVMSSAWPLYYSSVSLHRRHFSTRLIFKKDEKGKYNSLKEAAKSMALDDFQGKDVCVDFVSEIFISHVPTNLNYWHVQMEVKPALEEDDSYFRNGKSWREDVYTQLLVDILSFDFMGEAVPKFIDKKYYMK